MPAAFWGCWALLIGLPLLRLASGHDLAGPVADAGSVDTNGLGFASTPATHIESREGAVGALLDYKPIFHALRDAWYGKREESPTSLTNNHPSRNIILPGTNQHFVVPLSELKLQRSLVRRVVPPNVEDKSEDLEIPQLELRKRGNGPHRLHLTLSICRLPTPESNVDIPPPGLELKISYPKESGAGGETKDMEVHHLQTHEGFAYHVDSFSEDVSLEVHAPELEDHNGAYTYELTASVDEPYTSYSNFKALRHLDSDHQAGLFVTSDLTNPATKDEPAIEAWAQTGSPFTMFVHPQEDNQILGVRRSYCGLLENAQMQMHSSGVETGLTTLGGNAVKQQFYMPGLDLGASYHAILGLPSNFSKRGAGAPTGGGMVWRSVAFQTSTGKEPVRFGKFILIKLADSCQIVKNLKFCDFVSYAAPGPANGSSEDSQLSQVYDDYAQQLYQNFSLSLDQIACDTEPESAYSVATNCGNCAKAYKAWVCTVTIPRCVGPQSNSTGLIPEGASTPSLNLTQNPSQNPLVQPKPYSELPPCGNLCFGLVQNCPASLQFACPYLNTWYYNQSYGYQGTDLNLLTCNPGPNPVTPWGLSGASSLRPSIGNALGITIAMSACLTFGVI